MILLPRANPVKENFNPGKVNMADALGKLRQGKFTGYLRFAFPIGNRCLYIPDRVFVQCPVPVLSPQSSALV